MPDFSDDSVAVPFGAPSEAPADPEASPEAPSAGPESGAVATEESAVEGPSGALPEAESATSADAGSEPGAAEDDLVVRAGKADEYLALAQRTRADFDNFRKRAAREAALAVERGIGKLAKELLPAIDNLELAVQHSAPAANGENPPGLDGQLAAGVKLVHDELLAALGRLGIQVFSPVGEPFDPTLHEAVAQVPKEGTPSGTVVEVYQSGYRLGDTVLRPARVLVAA